MRNFFLVFVIVLPFFINYSYCQVFSGVCRNKETGNIIPYVNIQILDRDTHNKRGCITDENGVFTLDMSNKKEADSILFSCVGYEKCSLKIRDVQNLKNRTVFLKETVILLDGVGKRAKKMKMVEKILGVRKIPMNKYMGFAGEIRKGYECGVLIRIKKYTLIQKLRLNTLPCSYDTIFYKINIYKVRSNPLDESILQKEIYIRVPEEKKEGEFIFDLTPYNIELSDNFLVTLEHMVPSDASKDLGGGCIYFSSDPGAETYYRDSRSTDWEVMSGGISISLDVKMER
ncbi:MAG: carboxypeptidase-like regulatory domain-containing protein [Chitinophagaceae bacterium]|nr:carboxypeptidase-like regulatory domain-containing protein [Chitinophagaceae bacterium]